jgi:AAA family ATP:ADP antiporter
MQAFFALFYAGLTAFAFFLNLFLTSRFLKTVRMRFIILLTPLVLLLCSVSIIFVPLTLLPVIILKGSDEGLAFSLHQSVRELLYIPVFPELKRKAKPFIDMFINRGAKVFAALLLLIYAITLDKEVDYLTPVFDIELAKDLIWVIIGFLLIWTILSLKIFKEYVNAISLNIKERWQRAEKKVADEVDVDYTKQVIDMIESKDRSSVLYAMHMFDLLEQDKLTPEIKEMITQKSEEVSVSSLGDLFQIEGATWFPDEDDDGGQENLIKDIREIMSMDAYQQVMGKHAEKRLEENKLTEIERMELAKAIGLMEPKAALVKKLPDLILDESPEVSCYAIRSAARLQLDEHIPVIIQKLVNPKTHEDAVSALKTYGHSALNTLETYLDDRERDIRLRKAVVKVLANIGSQDAAKVLLRELERKTEELETEIVDALDRIRAEKTDLQFPSKLTQRVTLSIIKKYCQTFIDLHRMESSEKNKEHRLQLEKKLGIYFWDIFRLLGLYYSHKNIVKARQNIKMGTSRSVAYAIELLDNTLKKDIKNYVIPLVEDLPPEQRQQRFLKMLKKL